MVSGVRFKVLGLRIWGLRFRSGFWGFKARVRDQGSHTHAPRSGTRKV